MPWSVSLVAPLVGALILFFLFAFLLLRIYTLRSKVKYHRRWRWNRPVTTIGFFHPYANAGGGGERVLWHSIATLIAQSRSIRCIIYTGDRGVTGEDILAKASSRFGISFPEGAVQFVFLKMRWLVEPGTWPRFTLAGQSLGSIILGFEAFLHYIPNVYFDSMGYAFTYPLFNWLGRSHVVAYVHYPIVSTDMLKHVADRSNSHTNAGYISRSRLFTQLKLVYYMLFSVLYGFVGRRAHVVMVNSSWTSDHIQFIWRHSAITVVYPPCDTETFSLIAKKYPVDQFRVVSIGQFRPEKDHRKQLAVLKSILDHHPKLADQIRLVMIGGCRDEDDRNRVEALRSLAQELKVEHMVEFKVNIGFNDLQSELGQAHAAVHTMWNEHFGISLVECMAAHCIMVAHRSGGPLRDIVVEFDGKPTGFLAKTVQEFSDSLVEVMDMPEGLREAMATRGSKAVSSRFSVKQFEQRLLAAVGCVL